MGISFDFVRQARSGPSGGEEQGRQPLPPPSGGALLLLGLRVSARLGLSGVAGERATKAGFRFDHVVQHVEVDVVIRFDDLPSHLGVGDTEIVLLDGLEPNELHGVGIARVQDDLDEIDAGTTSDPKLEAVAEIDQGVSAEQGEAVAPELAGDGLGYHAGRLVKSPAVAAFRSRWLVWV